MFFKSNKTLNFTKNNDNTISIFKDLPFLRSIRKCEHILSPFPTNSICAPGSRSSRNQFLPIPFRGLGTKHRNAGRTSRSRNNPHS